MSFLKVYVYIASLSNTTKVWGYPSYFQLNQICEFFLKEGVLKHVIHRHQLS